MIAFLDTFTEAHASPAREWWVVGVCRDGALQVLPMCCKVTKALGVVMDPTPGEIAAVENSTGKWKYHWTDAGRVTPITYGKWPT